MLRLSFNVQVRIRLRLGLGARECFMSMNVLTKIEVQECVCMVVRVCVKVQRSV